MKYLVFILFLVTPFQVKAECQELRKNGLELSMLTRATPKNLIEIQKTIDGLIAYKDPDSLDSILGSKIASDYLRLNNYCLFLGSIERLLKLFIRSYEVVDLDQDQKNKIKEKSLMLVRKILNKKSTSQAVLLGYEVIFELADMGHFRSKNSELKQLKFNYEEFKIESQKRRKNILESLKEEKSRAKIRQEFYQKDIKRGREELLLISPFLPKG
tara:strand:+ start:5415 stop:6056 length:642 start_codon:yes stop_codon:yes gene_type:complete